MKKFGRAFLTTSAVILLLTNLVVILLYGRQFYACIDNTGVSSGSFCASEGSSAAGPIVWLNLIIVLVFVLIWFAIRSYRHRFPNG